MYWAMIAQLAGQVIGIGAAAFGQWWAKADAAKRKEVLEKAQAIYENLSPPELQELQATVVQTDFGNKNARNRALQGLMGMGEQGGMDEGSQLALEEARRASAQQSAQQQGAVRQQFQARGLGGAGEASLQLQGQQAGAQQEAMGGLQAASDARTRAMQALMAGGQMAQQAESADFGMASRNADAQDAFKRFNAEQRQQNFQNQLGIADRRYGAAGDMARYWESEAEKKMRIAGGVGQAFNQMGGSVGSFLGGKK